MAFFEIDTLACRRLTPMDPGSLQLHGVLAATHLFYIMLWQRVTYVELIPTGIFR